MTRHLISISHANSTLPYAQTHFQKVSVSREELVNIMCGTKCWSPIIWKDGVRKRENFLSCSLQVLDIDGGESLDSASEFLREVNAKFLIVPTKSHRKPKLVGGEVKVLDRYRLVLFCGSAVREWELYECVMREIVTMFHADKACKDSARWYHPSPAFRLTESISEIRDGKESRWENVRGEWGEVWTKDKAREWAVKLDEVRAEIDPATPLPKWAKKLLVEGAGVGERNTLAYRLAKELRRRGVAEEKVLTKILESPLTLGRKETTSVVKSAFR